MTGAELCARCDELTQELALLQAGFDSNGDWIELEKELESVVREILTPLPDAS